MGQGRVQQHGGSQGSGGEASSGLAVSGRDHRGAGGTALGGLGPHLELGTADRGAGRASERAGALVGGPSTPFRRCLTRRRQSAWS